MNIHLHHAIGNAVCAIENITGISFYGVECNAPGLKKDAISHARKYLAAAVAKLDQYEAEQRAKEPAAKIIEFPASELDQQIGGGGL